MTTPAFPENFPSPDQALVGKNAQMTQDFHFFLLALFNRTGAGPGLPSVGTFVGGDTLANDICFASGTVTLPDMQPGQQIWVFSTPGATVNAAAGGTIDGTINYAIPATKAQIFTCGADANVVSSLQLG